MRPLEIFLLHFAQPLFKIPSSPLLLRFLRPLLRRSPRETDSVFYPPHFRVHGFVHFPRSRCRGSGSRTWWSSPTATWSSPPTAGVKVRGRRNPEDNWRQKCIELPDRYSLFWQKRTLLGNRHPIPTLAIGFLLVLVPTGHLNGLNHF